MKWLAIPALAALAAMTVPAAAQTVVPIGNIAKVEDNSPSNWAISGFQIVRILKSDGQDTPIMRTEKFDARTVEILSRAQVPQVTAKDVRIVDGNKIVVRRYFLMQVQPQDAKAEGTTVNALARKWAAGVRRCLPQIAPLPSRFGV
jgi:parvulin-like peptidyl-prolyl isomerase